MKKLIRKILKEGFDDLEWVRKITPTVKDIKQHPKGFSFFFKEGDVVTLEGSIAVIDDVDKGDKKWWINVSDEVFEVGILYSKVIWLKPINPDLKKKFLDSFGESKLALGQIDADDDIIIKLNKNITESNDFEWTKSVDPLGDFNDYFYGIGDYTITQNTPGRYIKRGSSWWRNWIENVEMAHPALMEDVADLEDMVGELVNPRRGKTKKYKSLVKDIHEFLSPTSFLGGKNILEDSTSVILSAYNHFGEYSEQNNLTIFEVMDVFSSWLDMMDKEGKPLHKDE